MVDMNHKFDNQNKQRLVDEITCYRSEIRRINDKINLIKFLCEDNPDSAENIFNSHSMNLERLKKEKKELEKGLRILEEIENNPHNLNKETLLNISFKEWASEFTNINPDII
jgi:hypothetical protein